MSMPFNIRFRLSLMMFLQLAVWGAWFSVGFSYFNEDLGFGPGVAGHLFGFLWLACIVAPFVGGQIADRWFPTQYFLAISHLVGGVLLLVMAQTTDSTAMLVLMAFYTLLYAPTLALVNSLAFHHLKDPDREFGGIRVFGTLGWIAAGVALTLWRHLCDPAFLRELGGFGLTGEWFGKLWELWWAPTAVRMKGDLLYLAGGCSIAYGLFAFSLPKTPPRKSAENPLAFLGALKLLKDPNFAVFLAIAFVVTTELQFYFMLTNDFFVKSLGMSPANVPMVMTVAQLAEIVAMWWLLPVAIKKIGLKWTLALGVIAWPLRYVIFALGEPHQVALAGLTFNLMAPHWLVVASLAFHGFGYAFFFVASQIYVNNAAHSDIRASAQSLLTLVTLGVGMWLGTQLTVFIRGYFTTGEGAAAVTNWTAVFLVPCVLTAACAVAYLLFFKPPATQLKAEGEAA
jgi:nucleoside transporter